MSNTLKCISPADGRVFVERPLADGAAIAAVRLDTIVALKSRP